MKELDVTAFADFSEPIARWTLIGRLQPLAA
jgi:hypothetical protein